MNETPEWEHTRVGPLRSASRRPDRGKSRSRAMSSLFDAFPATYSGRTTSRRSPAVSAIAAVHRLPVVRRGAQILHDDYSLPQSGQTRPWATSTVLTSPKLRAVGSVACVYVAYFVSTT